MILCWSLASVSSSSAQGSLHSIAPSQAHLRIFQMPSSKPEKPVLEFHRLTAGRRRSLQALVKADMPTGILAYRNGDPVGWCSRAPHETYLRLERSPSLKRIDDLTTYGVLNTLCPGTKALTL